MAPPPRRSSYVVHHAIPFWRRDIVEENLATYTEAKGADTAFEFYEYNKLPKAYAVRGQALLKIKEFLMAALAGAPAGEV